MLSVMEMFEAESTQRGVLWVRTLAIDGNEKGETKSNKTL